MFGFFNTVFLYFPLKFKTIFKAKKKYLLPIKFSAFSQLFFNHLCHNTIIANLNSSLIVIKICILNIYKLFELNICYISHFYLKTYHNSILLLLK